MLDLKQIRENPQNVQELLNRRGADQYDLQPILELNQRQRELETSRTQ
ncbi:MAG TPA: serine--tRNA ligase, partial [Coleofasciculaceae cyanobacterium]